MLLIAAWCGQRFADNSPWMTVHPTQPLAVGSDCHSKYLPQPPHCHLSWREIRLQPPLDVHLTACQNGSFTFHSNSLSTSTGHLPSTATCIASESHVTVLSTATRQAAHLLQWLTWTATHQAAHLLQWLTWTATHQAAHLLQWLTWTATCCCQHFV